MNAKQQKQQERRDAIETLNECLKPGDTVYTVLRHVSRSGMTRWIDCYIMEDNKPQWISYQVAKVADYPINRGKREGIKVGGCGMDMGFSLVYNLSSVLNPNGFGCIGEGCPSNDHSNFDLDRTPHAKAKRRDCPGCKGTGEFLRHSLHSDPEPEICRTCNGKKILDAGHWHSSGGYAIKQAWM